MRRFLVDLGFLLLQVLALYFIVWALMGFPADGIVG